MVQVEESLSVQFVWGPVCPITRVFSGGLTHKNYLIRCTMAAFCQTLKWVFCIELFTYLTFEVQALSELCFHSHIQCSKLCKEIVSRVDDRHGKVDPLTSNSILCFSRNNMTSMWRSCGVLCDDGKVLIIHACLGGHTQHSNGFTVHTKFKG